MREGWAETTLSDVCSFQNGFAFKSQDFSDIGVRVIKIKELKDGEVKFFDDSSFISAQPSEYGAFRVADGDILFALTGDPVSKSNPLSWVGRVSKYKGRDVCFLNQRVCKAQPDVGIISGDFLYYHFRLFENFYMLASKATGSASQANISTKTIGNQKIILPPLPEQRAIAATLSCLDDKIELNNRINASLEAQAQAIFKSWFVNFEPFQDGEFVDSELGMIPKGWRVGTLGELAHITSGKRPLIKKEFADLDNLVPIIGASSIMGYTCEKIYDAPILIIGRVGTHGVVQRCSSACWPSDNTLVITSNNYEYAYQILKSVDYKNLNRGSTQPLITQADMKNVLCVIPQKNVFVEFEDIVSKLMRYERANTEQNRTLAALRDTLLPQLMSGKIEVPVEV